MKSSFASKITGTGSAFPRLKLTNKDLEKTMETSDEWIRERTGIIERRRSEDGNPEEFNSALGSKAALAALKVANKKPEDIDTILYGTCSPDTLVPSTACWLQNKIGAKNAWAMDLNAACSGFIYALTIADQFISSGKSKCVLVVGAEVLHPFLNWEDRTTCILFGDGAGAMIVEQTKPNDPHRILNTKLGSDGSLWDLFFLPAGGSRMEVTHEVIDKRLHKMQMKGKEIFKVAVKTLADYAAETIEEAGLKLGDIDWVAPHQANLRIIEAVAKRLDVPMSKVLVNVDHYANTSAATVPTAVDQAVRDGRIQKDHLVLMDVFGAGLTYGAALVRWGYHGKI